MEALKMNKNVIYPCHFSLNKKTSKVKICDIYNGLMCTSNYEINHYNNPTLNTEILKKIGIIFIFLKQMEDKALWTLFKYKSYIFTCIFLNQFKFRLIFQFKLNIRQFLFILSLVECYIINFRRGKPIKSLHTTENSDWEEQSMCAILTN